MYSLPKFTLKILTLLLPPMYSFLLSFNIEAHHTAIYSLLSDHTAQFYPIIDSISIIYSFPFKTFKIFTLFEPTFSSHQKATYLLLLDQIAQKIVDSWVMEYSTPSLMRSIFKILFPSLSNSLGHQAAIYSSLLEQIAFAKLSHTSLAF